MPKSRALTFTVPATENDSFLLALADGSVYQVETPEHIARGQKIVVTAEEDSVLLDYFHREEEIGYLIAGDTPKIVIGRRADDNVTGERVIAQMDKHICFQVPAVEECIIEIDDGRFFEVIIPEHVAMGQRVVASIDGSSMLLAYFHTEGEFAEADGSKLVIGNEIEQTETFIMHKIESQTVNPHHPC